MRRAALLVLLLPALASGQSGPAVGAVATPRQHFEARRFDEARAGFQGELAKNRNDANALYYLGRIADAQDRSGEAVDWFEKAVKQEPNNALYHFWLGNALGDEAQKASKLRQPFLARRVKSEFERAVALDPALLEPRLGLVSFYSMAPGIVGGSMEKAQEQADEIVKLNPLRGHLAHASLAQRRKDLAAEEAAYTAATAAAPDSAQGYYSLAAFYRRQSRWADAFATYERLQAAKPDEALARAAWGFTAAQSGTQMEKGEREIKFFLANQPADVAPQNVAGAHFRLGQIYEKTGRKDQARQEYGETLKLNPQHAEAKKALDALK